MPRSSDALSKMDLLVLSSLARVPMHGYELKLELRYRHVRWWAKCEHGHLYATLQRLSKRKLLAEEGRRSTSEGRGGGRTVFRVTAEGKRRLLESLTEMGRSEDQTYFDLDLFLAGSYLLEKDTVVEILRERQAGLQNQVEAAIALKKMMGKDIPVAGGLIIEHRIEHLKREARFVEHAAETIAAQKTWGPFLGAERITDLEGREWAESLADRKPEFTAELYNRVINAQSLQVDTISGATITSKAYLKAVADSTSWTQSGPPMPTRNRPG